MQSFSSSKIPIPVGATSSAQITHTATSAGDDATPVDDAVCVTCADDVAPTGIGILDEENDCIVRVQLVLLVVESWEQKPNSRQFYQRTFVARRSQVIQRRN